MPRLVGFSSFVPRFWYRVRDHYYNMIVNASISRRALLELLAIVDDGPVWPTLESISRWWRTRSRRTIFAVFCPDPYHCNEEFHSVWLWLCFYLDISSVALNNHLVDHELLVKPRYEAPHLSPRPFHFRIFLIQVRSAFDLTWLSDLITCFCFGPTYKAPLPGLPFLLFRILSNWWRSLGPETLNTLSTINSQYP
jgi:hypothetical protein